MVGDNHADVLVLERGHDALDVLDGDRVDACERLVEQDEFRIDGYGARDFGPSALASRKLDAKALADFGQAELLDQVFEPLGLIVFRKVRHLQHGLDVVFDREPPEYRSLLRQIPHAFLGAFVYRFLGDLLILEEDLTLVGLDQPDDHVERRRLAGAVGAEQPDDLALVDLDRNVVDDRACLVSLD